MLAEGLRQLDRWEDALGPLDLDLAVNCSARDLHDPLFADRVRALLGPDHARRLILEVTESLLVDDPRQAAAVLEALSGDGVRFAMDDFGTGYSSLSVVHALPVDKVKVDRAFVRRMHEDAASLGMVRTIVAFAKTLGTRVVAEGIETEDQLAALRALGCDYGQGYLFARPLGPEGISDLLQSEPAWQPCAP